jgi:predicted AAA+ superfamily ATPase
MILRGGGYFARKEKIEDGIHRRFMAFLRDYLAVGGMPEAVNAFLKTSSYQDSYSTHRKIMGSYQEDIKRYAGTTIRQKISDCYLSIPRQLAKEYTKFQYKVVSQGGSARRYENCLMWLADAGMIKLCHNLSTPQFPPVAYEKPNQFKAYVTDIGLLTSLYGYETQVALVKDTLTGPVKGGIYENLVFDMLTKRGIPLHYYKNDSNSQEIEFLYTKDGAVVPVEVKAKRGQTISLNRFIEQYAPPFAYKLGSGNLGVDGVKVTLPLYMAMFLGL